MNIRKGKTPQMIVLMTEVAAVPVCQRLLPVTLALLLLILGAGRPLLAQEKTATQPALRIVEIFSIEDPQAAMPFRGAQRQ